MPERDPRLSEDEPRERSNQSEEAITDNDSSSMGSEPSEADIRMRAYQRFLDRGGSDGQHFNDWLEAERELKSQK